ncbi:MAG: hypothetical protein KZQ58_01675 [gamma proteobacterium symbiont of Bathyaustriella thionipta]|nr:hypothetical protein [gamma proteobacterium symbiont of Bathyaustriella thionipta]
MFVAIKIEVRHAQTALTALPGLLELFKTYDTRVSFAFAMQPFAGGFLSGLLAGRAAKERQALCLAVKEAGHELGVLGYDADEWAKSASQRDARWVEKQMRLATHVYQELTATMPLFFSAPDGQMNAETSVLEQQHGFVYASDTRGKTPFIPLSPAGESGCIQIPVSLPTIDEMLPQEAVTADNVHEHIYMESQYPSPYGHVFAFDADRHGKTMLPFLEKMLVMWRGSQREIGPLQSIYDSLKRQSLPKCYIAWEVIAGRHTPLAVQGPLAG